MDGNALFRRWLSPLLLGLAGLCFLLPFATVSCGVADTTFTGVQLVTRTVPAGGQVQTGERIEDEVEGQASDLAAAALAAIVVGFVLGALGVRHGPGWCAAAGLASMLLLVGMSSDRDPKVTVHLGPVLALLLLASAVALHAARSVMRGLERISPHGSEPHRSGP